MGINTFNDDATFLCHVSREVIQLNKGSGMQTSFVVILLALDDFGMCSDVRQIFQDNGCPWVGVSPTSTPFLLLLPAWFPSAVQVLPMLVLPSCATLAVC